MKTKAQKQKELNEGKKLLDKSQVLIFTDFSGIGTADTRKFRQQLKEVPAKYFVIKKRLLGLLLKERGIEVDVKTLGQQLGTIFSEGAIEKASAPVFNFFNALGGDSKSARQEVLKKILGAYDIEHNGFIEREKIIFIGQLPPREIILAQLLGILAAPIRSLLYVLNEKATRSTSSGLS